MWRSKQYANTKYNSNKKCDSVDSGRDDSKEDVHVVNHNVIQSSNIQNNDTNTSVSNTSSVNEKTNTKAKATYQNITKRIDKTTTAETILQTIHSLEARGVRQVIDCLSNQQIMKICKKLGIDTGGTARQRKIGILRYYGIMR